MSDKKQWGRKLDPYSRMHLEDGFPAEGVEVTIRLTGKDESARQVEQAGLELHTQVADIIVGHVADATALEHIAELDCVQEVQVSRPLYEDSPDSGEKES